MVTIKEHYKELAYEFGSSKEMSMKDHYVKEAEINELGKYIAYILHKTNLKKILEIGCGNGYTAQNLSDVLNTDIIGIDFCEELIDIAKRRNAKRVDFQVGDVTNLQFEDETFDIIYSERCLINLLTWDEQKKALDEVHRVLKKNGIYIMLESFTDGLESINEARRVIGLSQIGQPFHNRYFDKKTLLKYTPNKFSLLDSVDPDFKRLYRYNFLSTYYFGSRVLYPALVKNGEVEYNNKFIEFFSYLEPYGNYSYVQVLVFQVRK